MLGGMFLPFIMLILILPYVPYPFNLVAAGASFSPMIILMYAEEKFEQLRTAGKKLLRAVIRPMKNLGLINIFYFGPDPSSTHIGFGRWLLPNGKTVWVPKYLTILKLDKGSSELKKLEQFKDIVQVRIIHLLSWNVRVKLDDIKVSKDGIEFNHAEGDFVELDLLRRKRVDHADPTPFFRLISAGGDKYLRDHPEEVLKEAVSENYVQTWGKPKREIENIIAR